MDTVHFPNERNTDQAFGAILSYFPYENVTLHAGYRYEDYTQNNFHYDGVPVVAENNILLGNRISNYHFHIMSAGMKFEF